MTEDQKAAYTTSYQLNGDEAISGSVCSVTMSDDAVVAFTNTRKTVNVTVKKTVVGSGGEFGFTAALTDGDEYSQRRWSHRRGSRDAALPADAVDRSADRRCQRWTQKAQKRPALIEELFSPDLR